MDAWEKFAVVVDKQEKRKHRKWKVLSKKFSSAEPDSKGDSESMTQRRAGEPSCSCFAPFIRLFKPTPTSVPVPDLPQVIFDQLELGGEDRTKCKSRSKKHHAVPVPQFRPLETVEETSETISRNPSVAAQEPTLRTASSVSATHFAIIPEQQQTAQVAQEDITAAVPNADPQMLHLEARSHAGPELQLESCVCLESDEDWSGRNLLEPGRTPSEAAKLEILVEDIRERGNNSRTSSVSRSSSDTSMLSRQGTERTASTGERSVKPQNKCSIEFSEHYAHHGGAPVLI